MYVLKRFRSNRTWLIGLPVKLIRIHYVFSVYVYGLCICAYRYVGTVVVKHIIYCTETHVTTGYLCLYNGISKTTILSCMSGQYSSKKHGEIGKRSSMTTTTTSVCRRNNNMHRSMKTRKHETAQILS